MPGVTFYLAGNRLCSGCEGEGDSADLGRCLRSCRPVDSKSRRTGRQIWKGHGRKGSLLTKRRKALPSLHGGKWPDTPVWEDFGQWTYAAAKV